MKPQIVQEVREQPNRPEDVGKVVRSIEPVVLNRVDMDTSYINHVKKDLEEFFKKLTEQVPERLKVYHINQREKQEQLRQYMVEKVILEEMRTTTEKCYNLTLAGYAPYDADPEVAFSVVVPWVNDDKSGINSAIGKEILDAYFELKQIDQIQIQFQ